MHVNINNVANVKNSCIQHLYNIMYCMYSFQKQTNKQTLVLTKPGRKTFVFPFVFVTDEKMPKEAKMFCCFIGYGKRMRTVKVVRGTYACMDDISVLIM
jgi:hypothetical protein